MRKLLIPVAAIAMAGLANVTAAQGPITADLRLAGASPTSKFANVDLNTGLGFGATLAYRLQTHLHVYGGWDWITFAADQSFAGPDLDFTETGYTFGLRFEHPLGAMSGVAYRLEAGGTYKHVEIENDDGDIIADSEHSVGFELGAGPVLFANSSWRVVPMLRFRSLSPEFDFGTVQTDGTLRYFGLELGISRRF